MQNLVGHDGDHAIGRIWVDADVKYGRDIIDTSGGDLNIKHDCAVATLQGA